VAALSLAMHTVVAALKSPAVDRSVDRFPLTTSYALASGIGGHDNWVLVLITTPTAGH
jgi:hypothetical protein